jgi:hypothetical protein
MKRPLNKICPYCKRKSLAPEGKSGDWWFPPKKVCSNCVEFIHGKPSNIKANRRVLVKAVSEAEAIFPLYLFDLRTDELLGIFDSTFEAVRQYIRKYLEQFPEARLLITDTKYRNFTDFF